MFRLPGMAVGFHFYEGFRLAEAGDTITPDCHRGLRRLFQERFKLRGLNALDPDLNAFGRTGRSGWRNAQPWNWRRAFQEGENVPPTSRSGLGSRFCW